MEETMHKHASPSMKQNAASGLAFGDFSATALEDAMRGARSAAEAQARADAETAVAQHGCDPPAQLLPFVNVDVSERVIVNQLRDKHVKSGAPLQYNVIAAALWSVHFACVELPPLRVSHSQTHDVQSHTHDMRPPMPRMRSRMPPA
jgi:hypothetical protein